MTDPSSTGAAVPTIAVAGELDLSTADALRARVDQVLKDQPSRVIFDFAALDFIDSSGLAVLIQVARLCDAAFAGPADPGGLCEQLMRDLATGTADDDIALIAARLKVP